MSNVIDRRSLLLGGSGFMAAAATYQRTNDGLLLPADEISVDATPVVGIIEGRLTSVQMISDSFLPMEAEVTLRATSAPLLFDNYINGNKMRVLLVRADQ